MTTIQKASEDVKYEAKMFTVVELSIPQKDGTIKLRQGVRKKPVVLIIPRVMDRYMMMKHEREVVGAYGGKFIYEFPAGHVECGENSRHAARRELKEETGIVAKSLRRIKLPRFYVSPGFTDETVEIFEAVAGKVGEPTDLNEKSELALFTKRQLAKMLEDARRNGEIVNGQSMLAIQYLLRK